MQGHRAMMAMPHEDAAAIEQLGEIFGVGAVDDITRYWTQAEMNTQLVQLVGFLPFNLPRGTIFMGDSGSTVLGVSLGALVLGLGT